jgi:hypothetical protein
MLKRAYLPRLEKPTSMALKVVETFARVQSRIDSAQHMHASNLVLHHVAGGLKDACTRLSDRQFDRNTTRSQWRLRAAAFVTNAVDRVGS